jgi:hypothetical protein
MSGKAELHIEGQMVLQGAEAVQRCIRVRCSENEMVGQQPSEKWRSHAAVFSDMLCSIARGQRCSGVGSDRGDQIP